MPEFFSAELPAYYPNGYYWAKLIFSETFLLEDRLPFSKHGPYHRVKLDHSDLQLTIPCLKAIGKPLYQVNIQSDSNWLKKHWESIKTHYNHLPYALYLLDELSPLYYQSYQKLSDFLFEIIRYLKYIWRIQTELFLASRVFNSDISEFYVDEWQTRLGFTDYLILPDELQYVKPKSQSGKIRWYTIEIIDDHLKNDLHHNALFLLFKYGTDLPGLIKKSVKISKEL